MKNEAADKTSFDLAEYFAAKRSKFKRNLKLIIRDQKTNGVIQHEDGQIFLRLGNELTFDQAFGAMEEPKPEPEVAGTTKELQHQ